MSKPKNEAYLHTYAVYEFDREGNATFVKMTKNAKEALDATKEADAWDKCRIAYSCRVRLYAANREWVSGSMDPLRVLDARRKR